MGLEIRCTVIPYRGFESHPFRQGIKHLGQPRGWPFCRLEQAWNVTCGSPTAALASRLFPWCLQPLAMRSISSRVTYTCRSLCTSGSTIFSAGLWSPISCCFHPQRHAALRHVKRCFVVAGAYGSYDSTSSTPFTDCAANPHASSQLVGVQRSSISRLVSTKTRVKR